MGLLDFNFGGDEFSTYAPEYGVNDTTITDSPYLQGGVWRGENPQLNPENPENAWHFGGRVALTSDPYDPNSQILAHSSDVDEQYRYEKMANQWAATTGMGRADYGALGQDYARANGLRGETADAMATQYGGMDEQARAANLMRDRALGRSPSPGAAQAWASAGQALAANQAAVGSTTGGAGAQALAGRTAAAQAGRLRAQAASQGYLADLSERENARTGYANAANALQGSAAGYANQMLGVRNIDLSQREQEARMAQFQAQQGLRSRQLALEGQLAYQGMRQNVAEDQLKANAARMGIVQDWNNVDQQRETARQNALVGGFTKVI